MQVKSIAESSHGAFCSTFDLHKIPHGFKTFVLSIFELQLKTGFNVVNKKASKKQVTNEPFSFWIPVNKYMYLGKQ